MNAPDADDARHVAPALGLACCISGMKVEIVVDDVDAFLQPFDVGGDFAAHLVGIDDGQPALLGCEHVDHLASTAEEILQLSRVLVG